MGAAPAYDESVHDRPWLSAYPPTVPPDIDLNALGTLTDMLQLSALRYADLPAYESFGVKLTFAQTRAAAERVAAWLQGQGFNPGDRIALMMPNVLAYPAALFGVLLGGYTVVNVNPLYTPRELIHQINDSGARVLIVLENFAHTVEQAWPQMKLDAVIVARPGDLMGFKGLIVNAVSRYVKKAVKAYTLPSLVSLREVLGTSRRFEPVEVKPDDVAFLQYTGGTTGLAKGATLLHRNVTANVAQITAWITAFLKDDPKRVMVMALPLYHIFALTVGLVMCRIGACSLLIANPRDIPGFIKTLKSSRFTCMIGVNTLYNVLANHSGMAEVDVSKLELCISGGMATQAPVAAKWKKLTGRPIIEGYGLSETSPVVTVNRLDLEEFSGTIGYPIPSTLVSIRREDGSVADVNEAGELCVSGPQVMAGYWQRPDETAKSMTSDGFFRTGDIAILLPDGQVKIVDRLKDMILVSGFNVYPNEVEEVIASHPKVLEVAVVGVSDKQSGEAVAAYVVPKDASLTAEELKAFCRENLTHYKLPRKIIFRDSLPKTNVGKVLRRALREEDA